MGLTMSKFTDAGVKGGKEAPAFRHEVCLFKWKGELIDTTVGTAGGNR